MIRSALAKFSAGRAERAGAAAPQVDAGFAELIYELLDAHADTAELAFRLELDAQWRAHLEYLRALQRHSRRVLAQLSVERAA